MNILRNETGPAACDHLQRPGGGGQVGQLGHHCLGKNSTEPRTKEGPGAPTPPGWHGSSGQSLSLDSLTPARSTDPLPA